MVVHLKPEQEAFLLTNVSSGRFASTDEALQEAVLLLERATSGSAAAASGRKSLSRLFADSPFRGLDLEFPRNSEPLRSVEI